MNIETLNGKGEVITSHFVAGTVDTVSKSVLNEECSKLFRHNQQVADGDHDYLYFFPVDAVHGDYPCTARVNIRQT